MFAETHAENNPELFKGIERENADVVLVILAGNSKMSVTNYQIYSKDSTSG